MKIIIHDLDESYNELFLGKCDEIIIADGKYAPCQGCFDCWLKTPAKCKIQDSLRKVCRILGKADEILIVTRSFYGSYSPNIKNIIDRSIGMSTTFSTYREKQMHHVSRYGWHKLLKVIVYGDVTEKEKNTYELMIQRNALNHSFENSEIVFIDDISLLGGVEL